MRCRVGLRQIVDTWVTSGEIAEGKLWLRQLLVLQPLQLSARSLLSGCMALAKFGPANTLMN